MPAWDEGYERAAKNALAVERVCYVPKSAAKKQPIAHPSVRNSVFTLLKAVYHPHKSVAPRERRHAALS